MSDPFTILGLPTNASEADAKKAYRRLAMQHHPDRNAGDASAETRFKEVAGAWEAVERGWRPGHPLPGQEPSGFQGSPGGPPGGFTSGPFEFSFNTGQGQNPFEDFMATMHTQRQRRNRDYNVVCQITLENAFTGADVTIPVRSSTETRTYTVKLPAGVDSGSRIRVPQGGERTHAEIAAGDLYVTVQVMPHERFERAGTDLIVVIDVDVLDILLGTTVTVEGIDGRTLEVRVPEGFDPASRMRVAGQGMVAGTGTKRGDLMVALRPRYPALTRAQLVLLEQARSAGRAGNAPINSPS